METKDEKKEKIFYKKLLIFGVESLGKVSFSNILKTAASEDNYPQTNEDLDIEVNQIHYKLKDGQYLNINLFEIKLVDKIFSNENLIDAFLLDCQCALFFIDLTNKDSFNKIKQLISNCNNDKYPYLKKIIIEIKEDIMSLQETETAKKLICSFLNINFKIDYMTISLQNSDNLDILLTKIYNQINPEVPEKNLIPINQISKCNSEDKSKINNLESFSLILLGQKNAGKTSFMLRYIENKFFDNNMSSTGINSSKQTLKIDGNYYQMTLWDTAGQERYRSIPRKYYRKADGILLLFDINDKESFDDVSNWMNEVKENCGESKEEQKNKRNIIIYLIANKVDLINFEESGKQKVTEKEIRDLVKKLGFKYFEISCKLNLNIEEVMARIILDCYKNIQIKNDNIKLEKVTKKSKQNKGCC